MLVPVSLESLWVKEKFSANASGLIRVIHYEYRLCKGYQNVFP